MESKSRGSNDIIILTNLLFIYNGDNPFKKQLQETLCHV